MFSGLVPFSGGMVYQVGLEKIDHVFPFNILFTFIPYYVSIFPLFLRFWDFAVIFYVVDVICFIMIGYHTPFLMGL